MATQAARYEGVLPVLRALRASRRDAPNVSDTPNAVTTSLMALHSVALLAALATREPHPGVLLLIWSGVQHKKVLLTVERLPATSSSSRSAARGATGRGVFGLWREQRRAAAAHEERRAAHKVGLTASIRPS